MIISQNAHYIIGQPYTPVANKETRLRRRDEQRAVKTAGIKTSFKKRAVADKALVQVKNLGFCDWQVFGLSF